MSIIKTAALRAAPNAFIFMKIGSHAGENLEEILERKQREIEVAGRTFWGYGGPPCHPLKQVQPFARSLVKQPTIFLLMEYINSLADPQIENRGLFYE